MHLSIGFRLLLRLAAFCTGFMKCKIHRLRHLRTVLDHYRHRVRALPHHHVDAGRQRAVLVQRRRLVLARKVNDAIPKQVFTRDIKREILSPIAASIGLIELIDGFGISVPSGTGNDTACGSFIEAENGNAPAGGGVPACSCRGCCASICCCSRILSCSRNCRWPRPLVP